MDSVGAVRKTNPVRLTTKEVGLTVQGATKKKATPKRSAPPNGFHYRSIMELDSAELPSRIAEARRTILDRAKEILTTSRGEHYFLNDALRSLLLLEVVAEREKRAS